MSQEKQSSWFKKRKVLTVILIVILLIIVGTALSGGGSDTTNRSQDGTGQDQSVESGNESKDKVAEKGIAGGMHKVGTDMPAGEYVIIGSGYLQISSDSTGSFESIIENDNYSNRTIITIQDGQYVQFAGRAYTWEEAPKFEAKDGIVPAGKYRIGVDFPAGEYKVSPVGGSGYYATQSSASGSLGSIIANDNFSSEIYVTISDGQYLSLSRAELRL